MRKSKRVEIAVMTFPAAAKMLNVSPTMIRKWVSADLLNEAFLVGNQHYRYVTVTSVERLRRERRVRDA